MFVRLSSEEEHEIAEFLEEVFDQKAVTIPVLPSPRISRSHDPSPVRPREARSTSRGRHSGPLLPSSTHSLAFIAPQSDAQATERAEEIAEGNKLGQCTLDTAQSCRAESLGPMKSSIQSVSTSKLYKSVGFRQQQSHGLSETVLSQADEEDSPTSQFGKASWTIDKGINGDPLTESKRIASWCLQVGDFQEAERLYTVLIGWCDNQKPQRIDRGYYRMKLQVGRIRFIYGDYKSSQHLLEDLLEKQYSLKDRLREPKEAELASETAQWLALCQWRQGRYATAEVTLADCSKFLPGTVDSSPNFLSTYALVLAYCGSFDRAWKMSEKVIKSNHDKSLMVEKSKGEGTVQHSSCLLNHARIGYVIGRLDAANDANQTALEIMRSRLGQNHFVTLDASSFKATLMVASNKITEAAEPVHRTLREMIEQLGESHPSTLQALETLVVLYKDQGRYSDAEETVRYLLSKNEHVLGLAHPQTLRSKTLLAEILLSCGKWEEAETKQREIIATENNKKSSDIDFPSLYMYQTTLAHILRCRGRWNEARTLAFRTLAKQLNQFGKEEPDDETLDQLNQPGKKESNDEKPEQVNQFGGKRLDARRPEQLNQLGKEDRDDKKPDLKLTQPPVYIDPKLRKLLLCPAMKRELDRLPKGIDNPLANSQPVRIYPSIVQTLHCLALCEQVRDDGDLQFTRGVLKMVTNIRERRLGEKHRLTVNARHDLAVNYRLMGKLEDSLKLIGDVVQVRRELLGTEHPDFLSARHQHAITLLRLGSWKRALAMQKKTLAAQEILLGKSHPDTVLSRCTLGGIHQSLNHLEEANKLLQSVIVDQMSRYGETHPLVLRSRARHALICLERGPPHLKNAEEEMNTVVKWRKTQLPKSHTLVISAENDLAQIIQFGGRPQEALVIYQRLENILYNQNSPLLAFQVRSNIGSCHFELGNYKEAEDIQRMIYESVKQTPSLREDPGRVIASTFNLALTTKSLTPDNFEEAERLLVEACDLALQKYGKDHPQTAELLATTKLWRDEEEKRVLGHSHTMA